MKKALVLILIGLIAGAVLMYLVGPARLPNKMKPAEPTSFGPVTGRLDSGGDMYAYFSTERFIRSIEKLAGQIAQSLPKGEGEEEKYITGISFVFKMIGKIGLNEISGVGLSNVGLPGGLNRTRLMVHHYADKNTGLIWQVAPTGPRTLTELGLLPADTALAAFNEIRLDLTWAWIKKELEASEIPEIKKFVGELEPNLAAQGLDLHKLLASLSGSMGYLITLDKTRTITIPQDEPGITIPEPGMAVVIGTKDATLFDMLKAKLPMAASSEKDGRKILQFQAFQTPIPLEPCVIQVDGYLIAATTPAVAEAVLQARGGTNGLTQTPEYKELAAHVPARGNGFGFLSPRVWQIYVDILKKAAETNPEDKKIMDALFLVFPRDMKALGVMERRYDGIIWTSCHNLPPETMVLMPLATVGGAIAAMVVPNLAQASEAAKVKSTMATLKTVGIAVESYIVDNSKSPQAASLVELLPLLVPLHIKELPLKDGWGHDLLYKKLGPETYAIASPGKDGVFQGWDQKGEYPAGQYDQDIIFSAGQFIYSPVRK